MCGRFSLSITLKEVNDYLLENFHIEREDRDFGLPRYNVAPGQGIVSIINDGNKNRVGMIKWGFIPPFAKEENLRFNVINAKCETLQEKPFFRDSLKNKRCAILADGFYEWKKMGKQKIPNRFIMDNQLPFLMAGLWSVFTKKDGTKIYSCTILTTAANSLVMPVHDRMPVILSVENARVWLNPKVDNIPFLMSLLKPYEPSLMKVYPVTDAVNNAKNETADCIKEIKILSEETNG